MIKDLTKGSIGRVVIANAIPLCLSLLIQQFYNIIDTMLVGRLLGELPLSGVGSTGCLNFMVTYFCIGLATGFTMPVAREFGAKNYAAMRHYVGLGIRLVVIFTGIITVLVAVLTGQLLTLMNTPDDIYGYAYAYIFVIFLGMPCTILYNYTASLIRALGDNRTPLYALIIATVLNIGMDLLFMTTLGLGVVGAALATILAQLISGLICLTVIIRKIPVLHLSGADFAGSSAMSRELIGVALPMGLQYSITAIGTIVVQFAVNSLGTMAVTGVTVAAKVMALMQCPLDAIGQSMAPYAGQNLGAKEYDRIKKGLLKASLMGFVWSHLSIPVIYFFGGYMTGLFVDGMSEGAMNYAAIHMRTACLFYIPLTLVNTVRFTIQGLGFSAFAMTAGVCEMVARTASALLLVPLIGFYGIALASPLAWLLADAFLVPAFFYCLKKVSGGLSVRQGSKTAKA